MKRFNLPNREDVTPDNQKIFDTLKSNLGMVPNLYKYYAKNDTALGDYLALQNRKTTLSAKEKEIVNLVTSQINGCRYCQSAHTLLGKNHGLTEEQILEIRRGYASFDKKIDALAKFTAEAVDKRGKVSDATKDNFFNQGYSEANLIDVILAVGDKTISNYIHSIAQFDIDFPLAEELEEVSVG